MTKNCVFFAIFCSCDSVLLEKKISDGRIGKGKHFWSWLCQEIKQNMLNVLVDVFDLVKDRVFIFKSTPQRVCVQFVVIGDHFQCHLVWFVVQWHVAKKHNPVRSFSEELFDWKSWICLDFKCRVKKRTFSIISAFACCFVLSFIFSRFNLSFSSCKSCCVSTDGKGLLKLLIPFSFLFCYRINGRGKGTGKGERTVGNGELVGRRFLQDSW